MATPRFYCSNIGQHAAEIDGEQADHARRVLRLTAGSGVELFDGHGTVADGVVEAVGRVMRVAITERRTVAATSPRIDLAVAIPKGDRAAMLVEKAAELGADRLIPLITERSVVTPGRGKIQRFERIAIEAAKQCHRAWVMRIAEPTDFNHLLKRCEATHRLICDIVGDTQSAGLSTDAASNVMVLIGPEGDWTDSERQAAVDAGFVRWRLAPHILRVETAALAALAILRADA